MIYICGGKYKKLLILVDRCSIDYMCLIEQNRAFHRFRSNNEYCSMQSANKNTLNLSEQINAH